MQADEDVGKIAMAVPVLVSKALELFLQDLCDRTYDITLSRGAKIVNAFLGYGKNSYNGSSVFSFFFGKRDREWREYAILDTADEDFKNLYDIVKLTCSENSIDHRHDVEFDSSVTSEHTSIQNPDLGISKENCFESKDSPRPDANATDGG
nr:dr1-associated corepressor-like [Ipomoea batatas]